MIIKGLLIAANLHGSFARSSIPRVDIDLRAPTLALVESITDYTGDEREERQFEINVRRRALEAARDGGNRAKSKNVG